MISIRGTARPWAWLAIGSVAVALAASCSSAKGPSASPSESFVCEDGGPKCGSGATGISTPAPDSGAGDSAVVDAETASVTVSVIQFLDTDFSETTSTPFKGVGIVSVPVPTGQADYPVGGDAGLEFSAPNVIVGPAWYGVRGLVDPDLMTTYSYLTLAEGQTSIAIPLIDRTLLSALYLQAAQASPLDTNAGQIIVRFYNSLGVVVSGVKITNSPFTGATSVKMYDTGKGGNFAVDVNSTLATGANGTVILANVTDGFGPLTYTYNTVQYQTPSITMVPSRATFARVTIPQ